MLTSATEHPLCVSLARSPESPQADSSVCLSVPIWLADSSVCLRFRGVGSSARLFVRPFGFSLFVCLFVLRVFICAFLRSVSLGSAVCLLLVLRLFVCVRVCLFGLRLFVCGISVCYELFGDDEALHPLLQPPKTGTKSTLRVL